MGQSAEKTEQQTTEEEQEKEIPVSPLDLSDDDFMNFDLEDISSENTDKTEEASSEDTNEGETEETAEAEAEAETESEDAGEAEDESESEGESESGSEKEDKGKSADSEDENEDADSIDEDTSQSEGDTEKAAAKDADAKVDYKKELERVLAPFSANGKEIQVDNVDDVITLMQMGANYNKKMQGLKPNLKYLKMLENNDLLDESKLGYLIDLDKKDPEAIKKLIKDSGINPLEIDVKEDSNYQPNSTYNVGDDEVELDTVLSDIRESTGFKATMDIIGTKWDEPSKKILVANPAIIRVINEHVETGVYDKISKVVERERMLGRLNGLSDIQAYKQVGDAINANGGFEKPTDSKSDDPSETSTSEKKKSTKPGDTDRKNRKKSASFTKSTSGKKGASEKKSPLSLSDEDFEKLAPSKYM